MNLRLLTLAGLASLALVAAGCGSDDSSSSSSSDSSSADTTQTSTEAAPSTTTEAAAADDAAKTFPGKSIAISNATDVAHKPKIAKPAGDPPSTLVVKDLVVGKGPAAKPGDTLSVAYVGKAFSTGKQFDASWDRPGPAFQFPLGGGQVIRGWDQGLVGMKKGGRRELIIPADLGYGPQGSPPDIAGGETLVFVVDLKKIN
jgi:peptidylprolyl isomerase